MNCPDCEGTLETIDFNGVKIDECTKCKGRWFDRGELRLAKDKKDDDIRWLDFDPFGKDAEELSVASEGKECPKCSKKMKSLTYRKSKIFFHSCQWSFIISVITIVPPSQHEKENQPILIFGKVFVSGVLSSVMS